MGITSKSLDVIPEKWVKFRRYSFRRYSLDVIPAPTWKLDQGKNFSAQETIFQNRE